MFTLFLDFDGVLHPEFCHPSKYFSSLAHFEGAVRRMPDVRVVISSTWRLQRTLEQLRDLFSADVARLIVGVTPVASTLESVPDSLLGYEREAECVAWLRSRQESHFPWLALDDRAWLFRPFSQFLYLTDGEVGLTQELAEGLVAKVASLR
ncbi:MAG: HAD domain-containing protein [Hydrogenophaga sp.]|nr:HAD domain-containing protein [Hydrogenophaga sp.]